MSSLLLPNSCASRANQVACQNVGRKRGAKRQRKVCLLSSHPLVLQGFEQALLGSSFTPAPRPLSSTLVPELRRLSLPRAPVYVVDAHLPRPSLEALVAGILERFPLARVVVVAEDFTEGHCFALLRLGVKGLISYADTPEQLPRALPLVAAGGYWVPRPMLSRFVDSILRSAPGRQLKVGGTSQLSRREQEALDSLLENLSNKEIASKLNISERTVKFHVSNLLAKFGVRRRADLILLCYQRRPAGS
jgi:DNA-binding NarL/FixJ family response regulator